MHFLDCRLLAEIVFITNLNLSVVRQTHVYEVLAVSEAQLLLQVEVKEDLLLFVGADEALGGLSESHRGRHPLLHHH
jgi:hypothetical protein